MSPGSIRCTRSPKIYAVHRPVACVEGWPQITYKIQRCRRLSALVARQIESSDTCFGTSSSRHALSIFRVGNVEILRTLFNDSRAIRSKMHTAALFPKRGLSRTNEFGPMKTVSKTHCNHFQSGLK